MPYTFNPRSGNSFPPALSNLFKPVDNFLPKITPLHSRGNRPLQMEFIHELKALVYFHLEEHKSGRHLLQALKEDDFARRKIAPPDGIEKSSFFEIINTRGLLQLTEVFQGLQGEAKKVLPKEYSSFGDLTIIDGSLIDATLSMYWADYRKGSKKAKLHLGFDVNYGIPREIFLTNGKGDERPFATKIIQPGQTGIMDRYYQCHKNFDLWQRDGKYFVCRIKENTTKTIIKENEVKLDSPVFYDKIVLLGTKGINQTEEEVRVVGYKVDGIEYWIATNRFDLSAEEAALIFKLRWQIEIFFGWWKQHLKVYHLLARSEYGLMVQIFAGLITYLLLAIYCRENFNEKVNIKRVRQLQIQIKNEWAAIMKAQFPYSYNKMSKTKFFKNPFIYASP